MLALEYGADTVWTEEIIDRKLMECTRVTNGQSHEALRSFHDPGGVADARSRVHSIADALGTVDFVTPKGNQVVLRTTARERPHVIVQLGTSTPELAVAAARVVAADVSGIDVNMGCPKRFSIQVGGWDPHPPLPSGWDPGLTTLTKGDDHGRFQGGMGAALLDAPDKAASIIRALREALPLTPVSCKIRLLETPEQTLAFVRAMEAAGACAISVHMRSVQCSRLPAWACGRRMPVDLAGRSACHA